MKKPSIALIGSGRAAKAIAAAARRAGVRPVSPTAADLVFLAVSDRAIEEVAQRLAEAAPGGWESRAVLHLSGAMGPEVLAPLGALGAEIGVLHPLTVFEESPSPSPSFSYRLEGSRRLRLATNRVVRLLWPEASEVRLRKPPDDRVRARYHAAAAMVANDLVALLHDGVRLFGTLGIPRRTAERSLARLAAAASSAVDRTGIRRGLTGPVVRGDVDTVRRHLEALRGVDPEIAEIHRLLSLRLVRIAREARRITPAQVAALRKVLAPARGGPRRGRGV